MLKQQVDEALSQLPEPLREVLILREMHELSYEQIAQVLRIPVGTVRSRLFTARQRFAELWREKEQDG
ncbi:MAG: sigma-70 family RNA polymerase sigma factor [Armatimonadota bacterium]|nr:sigma-70 family RNA polymerase sigma factor [Armatimonadota bacterium]